MAQGHKFAVYEALGLQLHGIHVAPFEDAPIYPEDV